MALSQWSDPDARIAYERAYDRSLGLWPIPCRTSFVKTPFGPTHVVESGIPGGDPIVLIHAESLSATQWYLQASYLGASHRLYAIDIMGDIGLSIQTRPIHDREDAASWLAAVLDGLDLDDAALVGSSLGGFHAANLVVCHPNRVRALVLLAPAATIKPFRFAANALIRAGSLLPLPATVRPGLRRMMQGELPDERIVRQMELGVAGFRYDQAGIYPSEIPDAELASIRCPTLVLLGDKEAIYRADEAADRVRQAMPAADVRIIPGVGHLLGMERPAVVNPRLVDFLAAAGPPEPIPGRT